MPSPIHRDHTGPMTRPMSIPIPQDMTTEQIVDLINLLLQVTGAELFVNSFDEVVVARGFDEAVLYA